MLFTFDVIVQHIIGPKVYLCLTISFILMFSVWRTVISLTICAFCSFCIAFWHHFYCALSLPFLLGSLFNHNLPKHFSASAKNLFVFLWPCLCFSIIACITVMLSIVDMFFFPVVCIMNMLLRTVSFWIFFTISYALYTTFVMNIPLWDLCLIHNSVEYCCYTFYHLIPPSFNHITFHLDLSWSICYFHFEDHFFHFQFCSFFSFNFRFIYDFSKVYLSFYFFFL